MSDLTGGSVELQNDEIMSILGASSIEDAIIDLNALLNARGGIEYTTTGHTGADVSLFAFGPGAGHLEGSVDNTEVGLWLADAMDLSFPDRQDVADAALANEIVPAVDATWNYSLM